MSEAPSHSILLAARSGVSFFAEFGADDEQAQTGAVDPIFAAIECHRAAATANNLAQSRADDCKSKANKSLADRTSDADSAAMLALIATAPTTIEGLRAGLEYVAANDFEGNDLPAFIQTVLQSRPLANAASP
jgi:hypothetical protein